MLSPSSLSKQSNITLIEIGFLTSLISEMIQFQRKFPLSTNLYSELHNLIFEFNQFDAKLTQRGYLAKLIKNPVQYHAAFKTCKTIRDKTATVLNKTFTELMTISDDIQNKRKVVETGLAEASTYFANAEALGDQYPGDFNKDYKQFKRAKKFLTDFKKPSDIFMTLDEKIASVQIKMTLLISTTKDAKEPSASEICKVLDEYRKNLDSMGKQISELFNTKYSLARLKSESQFITELSQKVTGPQRHPKTNQCDDSRSRKGNLSTKEFHSIRAEYLRHPEISIVYAIPKSNLFELEGLNDQIENQKVTQTDGVLIYNQFGQWHNTLQTQAHKQTVLVMGVPINTLIVADKKSRALTTKTTIAPFQYLYTITEANNSIISRVKLNDLYKPLFHLVCASRPDFTKIITELYTLIKSENKEMLSILMSKSFPSSKKLTFETLYEHFAKFAKKLSHQNQLFVYMILQIFSHAPSLLKQFHQPYTRLHKNLFQQLESKTSGIPNEVLSIIADYAVEPTAVMGLRRK